MNKPHIKFWGIFGYIICQFMALLACLIVSFLTWGVLLYRPHGTGPGDGMGYMLILFVGGPIWTIITILSPSFAHDLFKETSGRLKRIAFSFFIPVLSAAIISAMITLLLELIIR